MRRPKAAGPLALVVLAFVASAAAQEQPAASPATFDLRGLRGPKADVAALLLGGRESGSLRAAALARTTCAGSEGDAKARVDFHVEIETASLLQAVESQLTSELPASVRLEIYAYAISAEGSIADHLYQWVRLPIVDLTRRGAGGGVKLAGRLELDPGEYQIRALVREASSQQFALRILGLAVPSLESLAPSLGPPSIEDPSEGWLLARTPAADAGPSLPPAALPVLYSGQRREVGLTGCRIERSKLSGRLLDRERQPISDGEAQLQSVGEQESKGEVRAALELPRVEPGLYLLEISASSRQGKSTASIPIFVADPEESGTALAWTALGGARSVAPTGDAPQDRSQPGDERASKPVVAFSTAYLGALDLLSLGRLDEAVARLGELEQQALDDEQSEKAMRWLTEGQNRVTRDLLRHDPETLLPLLMLHLELQQSYAARGASARLLSDNRSRIRSLAQVYAEEAEFEMAPTLAAQSLVEMSEELQSSGLLLSALVVLREALVIDPNNPRAILGLAYQYEHHGFTEDCLEMLRRLLEIEPRSEEGRLRLAISYLRSDRVREAEQLLSQVIADASTDWVLAVAYQELASLLKKQERYDDAVAVLRNAVVRLPDVQRVYLELAYVLDRTGQRAAGRKVIAEMPTDNGDPSPRLLYRVRSLGAAESNRPELLRHGMARLPQLGAALASIGARG